MKTRIRLTESDLHRVIRESVNRILNERTRGEEGMTDDEVLQRRRENFIKDMDASDAEYNRYSNGYYKPNYSDRLEMNAMYDTPEGMNLKVDKDRIRQHHRDQQYHRLRKKYGDNYDDYDI